MDTENVPPTVSEPLTVVVEVQEKKKFYRNPKVVAGVVAGFIATGAAVVIAGLKRSDSSDTEPTGEDDTVVETFSETETPSLD